MPRALTEDALRDVLTKAGLPIETVRLMNHGPRLPGFKVEIAPRQIAFDQLHMLVEAFDTWMITVGADHGHEAGLILTIAKRED